MTRLKVLVLLCVLTNQAFGQTAKTPSSAEVPTDKAKFHLFLLVGQSNMAGRGEVTDADRVPRPRVLMLNQQQQWVPAIDPLHFDKPKMAGVGLGRSFADEIAKTYPDVTIGLIPCAVGGSSITCWQPGGFHEPTKTHPYDDTLNRLHEALKFGTLKGILWHQGEADSTPKRSASYETRLHTLIGRLRDEAGSPEVPFIVGQLGQFKEKPWNEDRKRVNSVHASLPEHIGRTAFVSSDGLVHKGDQSHFDSDSYREFGRRYAKAYLSMDSADHSDSPHR
tara:strand:+ start:61455 stop:62291 length:837 start_codon:yes stop_codon:yes gene_type:complete